MVLSDQIVPGMTLKIGKKLYRVESCVKVQVPKGTPFVKTRLAELNSHEVVEKNFKPNQSVADVAMQERPLEYLYLEGKDYLFLEIQTLEQVLVPAQVVGNRVNYLKEGTEVMGFFYGDSVFSVDLPQFLELMVAKTDEPKAKGASASATKQAILETGAKVEVPPFIEVGDIIKVDTKTDEYIQRV